MPLTLSFALTTLLIELTPGPNMVWLALLSAREGLRAGLAAALGILCGLTVLMIAVVLGFARLVAECPALGQAMGFVGVAFMVWLAWDAWRESNTGSWEAANDQSGEQKAFRRGFLINLLNAKAALFFLTVFPNFIDDAHTPAPQYLVLGLIYLAIATAIHIALAFGGETLGAYIRHKANSVTVRAGSALALLAAAAWMASKAF
ncbi:conserved membrane hypothetical protein [Erythrobacter sp. EC-HK427]|nr:conserved membrane hypothetical protein [Erythrobacter sp. EC-HK427]